MKSNKKFTIASVSLLLFVLLVALLKKYDVAAIGPEGTEIGFSHINRACHEFFGVNMLWYDITEILGYLAIAIAALFAFASFMQLVKRKSLAEVDKEIYALAGLYVAMGAFYVAFEKVVVNFRPVILPDETSPEASFPSSHTMLACVIFGSAIVMTRIYMEKDAKLLAINIILCILIFITVFGRLISGVHWLTDIAGGVLISIFLVSAFDAVTCRLAGE